jgi:FKBP-type peptidyl-prolyl cis-trans isomerase FkpA
MKLRHTFVAVFTAVGVVACGQPANQDSSETEAKETAPPVASVCPAADESGNIQIAPGLDARILKTGYGRSAVTGDYADTNVWLWLYDETAEDGHGQFIWESGSNVFQFQLGAGQVIKGWDLGVPCMLEGETRELVVSGDLAYGPSGRGEIPPNATLIFTIELLKLTTPQ